MKDNEWAGVGNHNTALFGEYDTRTARRSNLDPKPVDGVSPYSVFGNNPIWHSDALLDTPVVGVNPNKDHDKLICEAAAKQKDEKNAIHIFAHGDPTQLQIYNAATKKTVSITTAQQFDAYMDAQGIPEWDKAQNGGNITLILHSCRTGAEETNPQTGVATDRSIAKQISEGHPNISVIAPTQRDYFSPKGEMGPYKTTNTDINGNRIHRGRISRYILGDYDYLRTNEGGHWKTYRNGKVTQVHNANWVPTRKGSAK